MWYTNSYRRHLCDMHIEDWNDEFLSEFDIDEYFKNIKAAHIQSAMIYLQSHVGYCYYPTKVGKVHKAFVGREYDMQMLVKKIKDSGMDTIGYYSLIYNTWAHDKFPSWKMINKDGHSRRDMYVKHSGEADYSSGRYGLCCPNNLEYREFVFKQIDEMASYVKLDALFYDMLFWPHFCYCPACVKRWEDEVGTKLPITEDRNSPKWRLHLKKRREWMTEFANSVSEYTKKKMPGITVELNLAYSVIPEWESCQSAELNDVSEFTGGDLYGGIFNQSFTCKFYRNLTKNQPFEYMFSRCKPNLTRHTITKSFDEILSSVMITCAHHGATMVIDAIDPKGTMDSRVYDKIGKAFEVEKKYEKYLTGNMIEDIGIYYSFNSKFTNNGNAYKNPTCAVNVARTYMQFNIPYGVCGAYCDISKYKMIFASCLTDEDNEDVDRILKFLENGGKLIFSDGQNKRLMKELLGMEVTEYTHTKSTYIAPVSGAEKMFGYFNKNYPMPFEGYIPIAQGKPKGRVLANLVLPYTDDDDCRYASIHSNPPGIPTDFPVIVEGSYKKGKFIWLAPCLEYESQYEYRRLIVEFTNHLCGSEYSILCNASKDVEVVSFNETENTLITAFSLSDDYYIPEIPSFEISLKCSEKPKRIIKVPDGEIVDFEFDGGYAKFATGDFNIAQMFKAEM